ncbi:protein translocase subunit SecDF [Porphyromonas sp.]|uniref:protein translocase subunit SecDF n=1 Tax=Porphyromonas sp. TaxID=1924944 RepID=UPI0026DD0052|nr:protein translocase subunit SecDF [Porphyromonas sp.]MDO4695291.1 protein translocase subunit SecDF [Porphyromonas sp.]MDO4770671.1 protein translocase subunit SecDF [Porphyromonas sp.]
MQNKGLVKGVALVMVLICAYYLSFSFVSGHYTNKAKEYAQGDPMKEIKYLDSLSSQKVWLGQTLKQVRDNEIGLGLDLKGGMNVILELNVADVVKNLSGSSQDPTFLAAMDSARDIQMRSQKDFITVFIDEFHRLDPGARLAAIFGTLELKDRISTSSSDSEVEKVLRAEVQDAIDSSFKVLRTRIDRFGVVAPNIQRLETHGRILVELPGVKEPERVRKLLQGSANLEFWETYTATEVIPHLQRADMVLAQLSKRTTASETEETVAETTEMAAEEAPVSGVDSLAMAAGVASTEVEATQVSDEHPLLSLLQLQNMGPAVGVARSADINAIDSMLNLPQVKEILPRQLKLRWSAKEQVEGSKIYTLYAIKQTRRDGAAALSGDVITTAESTIINQHGRQDPGVSMSMNAEGAKEWARLTKENIGRSIAIVLDDVVYSAPNVTGEIPNGQSQISGSFTVDEANDLANTLKSGKMAASVRIVQEDVVGPSLGKEAINAGIVSFIIALILLMIYMCVMYGLLPGLVVNGALILNLFLTLGILASLHAVLTLSGIAGLVLTLGMAVDANVLIFERIKEELRGGKSMLKSIEDGYKNAFSAIIDSNVTTIITGIILYMFGTGPIRGFATTLIIGLICSFITAVFITRLVFEGLARRGKMNNVTYTTAVSKNFMVNAKLNIIGKMKSGFLLPLALIIAGVAAMSTIGLNSGIDFTGGRNYVVKFDRNVTTAEVSELLSSSFDGSVRVITIGTPDQVRISTNYRIIENTPEVDAEIENKLYEGLKPIIGENVSHDMFVDKYIQSSQKVGASMADDIKSGAVIAVIVSLIFMAIYILIRFRDIAFSIGAFASVTVTTLIIISLYAILWKIMPFSMEIDQNFIAAVLAIIGYSINDTVVVFDRIRETLKDYPTRNRFDVFNQAINSTLARTFNTSFSTLLVVLVIFFFGGANIRSFTFAIMIGVIFGTYATLFVATPIAYLINNRKFKKLQERTK